MMMVLTTPFMRLPFLERTLPPARADSLAQDLDKRFSQNTQIQSLWLPAIRAQSALDRKNSAAALNTLRVVTSPIELGQIPFADNISCLYHVYIHGEVYLAAGQRCRGRVSQDHQP